MSASTKLRLGQVFRPGIFITCLHIIDMLYIQFDRKTPAPVGGFPAIKLNRMSHMSESPNFA